MGNSCCVPADKKANTGVELGPIDTVPENTFLDVTNVSSINHHNSSNNLGGPPLPSKKEPQPSIPEPELTIEEVLKKYPPGSKIIKALYDFEGCTQDDLSFQKNELMVVIDDADGDWWYASHVKTKREGYVPSNYVAPVDDIYAQEWYRGKISRKEAEKILLYAGNPIGTFLIRESENSPGGYSLSIRDYSEDKGDNVKHYKIRAMDNGGYFITARRTFRSLDELVHHYTGTADGLCSKLVKPCPREAPAMTSLGKDMWEIPRETLQFKKKLGSGQFGDVWEGMWNNTTRVAIKTLKPGTMTPEAFLQEANMMKTLRHEKLVQLLAVCSDREPLYIICEFMCNGALLNFLREGDGQYLKIPEMIDMAAQTASGMAYIESQKFIHRDLAARNVLIGNNNTVKVADFGLARIISEDLYVAQQGARFPIKWSAPESISYGKFTIKSDVWSFGILLYELFTKGQVPYPGMSNTEVSQQLMRGYRMPRQPSIPEPVYDVMRKCWQEKELDRPTFEFLRDYFDNYAISAEGQYEDQNEFQ